MLSLLVLPLYPFLPTSYLRSMMDGPIHDDITFTDMNYDGKAITGKEFNGCTFIRCNLNDCDLANNKFIECVFDSCNLSLVKLNKTTLTDVSLKNCKMLGVNFTVSSNFLFSVSFEGCRLDYSSFMDKKMLRTRFSKTTVREVSFIQANLGGAIFNDCDLENAVFDGTDLSGANFSTAYNYTIDPDKNNMNKAVFSLEGVAGLLNKYDIKIV